MSDHAAMITFLSARIDEDQVAAESATANETWTAWYEATLQAWDFDDAVNEYVLRLTPARMLAEVNTKRRIIAECEKLLTARESSSELDWAADLLAIDVLRLLTLTYTDHPDFDPSWRVLS